MPSISLTPKWSTESSNDSDLLVSKRALPLYYHGPYTQDLLPYDKKPPSSLDYVAPLGYYCIKCLLHYFDQLDLEGSPRLIFDTNTRGQLGLMKMLIPFFSQRMASSQLKWVDPRLWATLIQLFNHLPSAFKSYSLPLSDIYLPLLQTVKSSVDFTLVTVLDLSCEMYLTDDTIGQLKPLTNLCVLDLGSTKISSWGIKQLSMCLTRDEASGVRSGPWDIRILSMRSCRRIRDDVKAILQKFPLLSVVDLRETSVTDTTLSKFQHHPSPPLRLCYYPCSTISWIDALWTLHSQELFKCRTQKPHTLHVDTLEHPPPHMICDRPIALLNKKMVSDNHKVLVLPPGGKNKCQLGDNQKPVCPLTDRDNQRFKRSNLDYDEETEIESSEGYDHDDYVTETWEDTARSISDTLAAREFYAPTSGSNLDEMSKTEQFAPSSQNSDKDLRFMFFRHPPSVDSVHTHSLLDVNDTRSIRNKQLSDSILMRKKAKMADFTRALLSTTSEAREDGKRNSTDNALSIQVSVPVNPFRAKNAPRKQTSVNPVTRTKADLNSADQQEVPFCQPKKSNITRGFDMKAWTSKTKK